MNTLRNVTSILIGAALLASCQTGPSFGPGGFGGNFTTPASIPESRVNGRWEPTNEEARKIYYNEFRDGKFVSKSPDGTKTIAAGNYTADPSGSINLKWYSEARKANQSANCTMLNDAEMQCTSGASVFNLRRT